MATRQDLSIMQIEDAVDALDHDDHARFERLFHVSSTVGRLVPPESMIPWIERQFAHPRAEDRQDHERRDA
jgi:hypothetical protein